MVGLAWKIIRYMPNQKSQNFNEPDKLVIVEDHLEKTMVTMPVESTDKEKRHYLAGIIDCLNEIGMINESEREDFYCRYVG